jgi:hypothetical protein
MAIPKDIEPFLEGFTAEEKTLFDNLLTKSPKLGEGWLRQSDYDRKMNASKEEVKKATDRSRELEDWWTENKPIHEATLERARELEEQQKAIEERAKQFEDQTKELQKKLQDAEARRVAEGGEQVDPVELARRVQEEVNKLGYVNKSEMETIIAQQTAKLAGDESKKFLDEASKKFYEETLPASVNFAADVAEICVDHKTEFQEYLDRKALSEFMAERKMTNPKDAYKEFVKPRRDELEFKRKVDEEVKQRISGMAVNGIPVTPGAVQAKGALQMKVEKDAGQNSMSALAAQAAQELRQEGKV